MSYWNDLHNNTGTQVYYTIRELTSSVVVIFEGLTAALLSKYCRYFKRHPLSDSAYCTALFTATISRDQTDCGITKYLECSARLRIRRLINPHKVRLGMISLVKLD